MRDKMREDRNLAARLADLAVSTAPLGSDLTQIRADSYNSHMRSKGYTPVVSSLLSNTVSDYKLDSVNKEIQNQLRITKNNRLDNNELFLEDLERKKIVKQVYSKHGLYDDWE